MPGNPDNKRFRNEDLILKVSQAVDRAKWDESRYEGFMDGLCGGREYQKEAMRTALRYLLGGEYAGLRALARVNFDDNSVLAARYGSWGGMERHLQLPDQLSASLDLATGTGKSYVLYGLAAIMLAEGAVDRVLVLCPSTTIEDGLLEKFRGLASDADLRALLPPGAAVSTPHVINASESITPGCVCVENYHAILEHVKSSIRESLTGNGGRTLVLNDEAHHIANESESKVKRWKEFLADPAFGFGYIIGVSGTCYVGNDYFSDVIYRYSLREAIEQNYVKKVEYIAEMPRTGDPDEKWQLICNHHEDARRALRPRKIRPLTIIVTPKISRCKEVAEELKGYLTGKAGMTPEQADERVLVIHNGAPDVAKLATVDKPASKVEWIVAVSMLNEGWDVKRVFQIVPHEERAFNSKLLIAQVLGRGLRIPIGWRGEQPTVTVFNHDRWAERIREIVKEILEIEKRLTCRTVEASPYHFDLHNIDYTLEPTYKVVPMAGPYTLFEKGFVDLATETPSEDVSIRFEDAVSGRQHDYRTRIRRQTYTPRQVAEEMFSRLEEAQDPEDPDPKMRTVYTDQFPVERLEAIVRESLGRITAKAATESMKQKFLQSLGTLRREESQNVRYRSKVNARITLSTRQRPNDSVSAAELRGNKTFFYTDQTRASLVEEQVECFDEATEAGSGFKVVEIRNRHDFKSPLSAVIADSDPEKRFIGSLIRSENVAHYEAWVKSTSTRFYEIDYAWKKGEHPKRGKFNPDFFIKTDKLILVMEVKADEDLKEISVENRKKNEYALAHFVRVNRYLERAGSPVRYKFHFITPRSFGAFFQCLQAGTVESFRSEMDVRLSEPEEGAGSRSGREAAMPAASPSLETLPPTAGTDRIQA